VAITLVEPREHRMIKAIEKATKQKVTVAQVPSVADLRLRRLELTRASLYESLLQDDLEPFRAVVESLTDEFDLMEVALAAVRLAHNATSTGGDGDDEEIPAITLRADRPDRGGSGGPGGRFDKGGSGGRFDRGDSRGDRGPGSGSGPGRGRDRAVKRPNVGMTRLFVSLGRSAGVRPQDLVGAITGETELAGRDIGAIEITDRFSLVEVPDHSADDVIAALSHSRIKGNRATVRRER
jgi:ATP-dependent RNA helicase DeaD